VILRIVTGPHICECICECVRACGRYNKLGLDGVGDDGKVAEVHSLTRVTSEPLSKLHITSAALGHTHAAVVTGALCFH